MLLLGIHVFEILKKKHKTLILTCFYSVNCHRQNTASSAMLHLT